MEKVFGLRVFCLFSLVTSLAGATAGGEGGAASSAKSDHGTSETSKNDDAWRPRATGALGVGATASGTAGSGPSYRGMIGVEPKPWLFVGASYRGIHAEGREWKGTPETFDTQLVTAALELHPLGRFWADPYVSAEVGYGHTRRESGETVDSNDGDWGPPSAAHGVGTALGLGFAFRGESFAIGPQATLIFVTPGVLSVTSDLRIDARF